MAAPLPMAHAVLVDVGGLLRGRGGDGAAEAEDYALCLRDAEASERSHGSGAVCSRTVRKIPVRRRAVEAAPPAACKCLGHQLARPLLSC